MRAVNSRFHSMAIDQTCAVLTDVQITTMTGSERREIL